MYDYVSIKAIGTADATEADKLHDADGDFINKGVEIGSLVENITDSTSASVTAVVDSGELTLDDDIFVDGEDYRIHTDATPDKDVTLTLEGRGGPAPERAYKNDVIHMGVDGSEERIDFSDGVFICFLVVPYNNLKAADSGTLMDTYFNSATGNGCINTFKLQYSDGHTYVVRHAAPWERKWHGNLYSNMCLFRVMGRITDT